MWRQLKANHIDHVFYATSGHVGKKLRDMGGRLLRIGESPDETRAANRSVRSSTRIDGGGAVCSGSSGLAVSWAGGARWPDQGCRIALQ